ncbi:GAF domain-containing protein [Dietzia maris]
MQNRLSRLIAAMGSVSELATRESVSLDSFLVEVGRQLTRLLEISRFTVYLRRPEGTFECRVGWSSSGDITPQVNMLVTGTDGMTAQMVRDARPVLVRDARNDPRADRAAMVRFNVRDILAVPLLVDDEIIGSIYVDNEDQYHDYSDEDVAIADAFGKLAAVAVRLAHFRTELESANEALRRTNVQLQRASKVNQLFTRTSLEGAELKDLLRITQELMQRPVLLYSPKRRLIGWSAPPTLKLANPPLLSSSSLVRLEREKRLDQVRSRSVLVSAAPAHGIHHRRLIAPLTTQKQVAGYIEAVEIGRPFTPAEADILAAASIAVSFQFLFQQREETFAAAARQDFLNDLLDDQHDLEAVRRRAPIHDIDPDNDHYLIRATNTTDSETGGRETLEDTVTKLLPPGSYAVRTSVPGADLYLFGLPSSTARSSFETDLKQALPNPVKLGYRHILVSDAISDFGAIAPTSKKLRSLEQSLLSIGTPPRLVLLRSLGLLDLLISSGHLADACRRALEILGPLIDSGSETDSAIRTFRCYLASNGHIRQTAKTLGVHENTVRYRLEKVQNLTGLVLSDLTDLTQARLLFELYDLSASGTGTTD